MKTDLPDGYKLSRVELTSLLPKMKDLPVTYEHTGIHNAVKIMQLSSDDPLPPSPNAIAHTLNAAADPQQRTFGTVLNAFETKEGAFCAVLDIDVSNKPGIYWSIATRQLGSVSLTHCTLGDGSLLPLEISVVGQPARPRSDIIFYSSDLNECLLYKARLIDGSTPHTAIMEIEAPAPTTCAEVIQRLPEAQRKLVADRLEQLVAWRDESQAKLVTANKQLQETSSAQQVDHAVMKGQLESLLKRIPVTMLSAFGVPEDVEKMSEMFKSESPVQTQQAALRTIMCANHALMMQEMKSEPPVAAPMAVENTAPAVVETPAPVQNKRVKAEPSESSPMSLLERALTEQFEN